MFLKATFPNNLIRNTHTNPHIRVFGPQFHLATRKARHEMEVKLFH